MFIPINWSNFTEAKHINNRKRPNSLYNNFFLINGPENAGKIQSRWLNLKVSYRRTVYATLSYIIHYTLLSPTLYFVTTMKFTDGSKCTINT
jgi:hypothetical protein